MRKILALLLLQASTTFAYAADVDVMPTMGTTAATAPQNQTIANDKAFSFLVGFSAIDDGDEDASGSGITTAAEWNINRYVGLGASYASYDPSGDNFSMVSGYLKGNPIHYSYSNWKFSAGAQLGAAEFDTTNTAITSTYGAGYYLGLALEANYNNNVGFRLESRMANADYSYSSVGLVGYY